MLSHQLKPQIFFPSMTKVPICKLWPLPPHPILDLFKSDKTLILGSNTGIQKALTLGTARSCVMEVGYGLPRPVKGRQWPSTVSH